MRQKVFASLFILVLAGATVTPLSVTAETLPLTGKMIALDAGHGGTDPGACNPRLGVCEKEVNLAVALELGERLAALGASVVYSRTMDETIATTLERVDRVNARCQVTGGRDCDLLVSVHHNASSNPDTDGTMVIYNGKTDKAFATAIHDALITAMQLPDHGYEWGGYGITVRGGIISVLTEAFYLTNDSEAAAYLAFRSGATESSNSILQEVSGIERGIVSFVATQASGGGKKGGRK